jgi:hypothetical protein
MTLMVRCELEKIVIVIDEERIFCLFKIKRKYNVNFNNLKHSDGDTECTKLLESKVFSILY